MEARIFEVLKELAFENPRPEERWVAEDHFDPQFHRGALRAAARAGRIELNMGGAVWQFRFTAKGRDEFECESAGSAA